MAAIYNVEDGPSENSPLLRDNSSKRKWTKHYLDVVPELEVRNGKKTGDLDLSAVPPLNLPKTILVGTRKKGRCRRFYGIIFAVAASLFLSLTTLLAKLLIGYHPFNVAIWRFEGILIPSLPFLVISSCYNDEPVFDSIQPLSDLGKFKTFILLFLRAIFGCSAVIMQFYSIQYIEIGDATVISFTTPVFVGLLSHVLLGERFGIVSIVTAVLAVVGIAIIARPPILSGAAEVDWNNLIGAGMALGCMFFASFTYVILRSLRHVHCGLVTFFYGFYSVLECAICALAIGVLELPRTGTDWTLAISLATLAFAGQSFFTQALKFEEAGPVSLIRTSEVIFTFIWQAIFLSVIPDGYSVVGALTIVAGVVVTTLRKWATEMDEDDPLRQKLWFLMK